MHYLSPIQTCFAYHGELDINTSTLRVFTNSLSINPLESCLTPEELHFTPEGDWSTSPFSFLTPSAFLAEVAPDMSPILRTALEHLLDADFAPTTLDFITDERVTFFRYSNRSYGDKDWRVFTGEFNPINLADPRFLSDCPVFVSPDLPYKAVTSATDFSSFLLSFPHHVVDYYA